MNLAQAKPKIVTTISPVAGIITMLTGDSAEVIALNTNGGCPHHYHLKPSDLKHVNDADIIIYIDEKFDGEIIKLSKKSNARLIRISDNKQINFMDGAGNINYHFWLDLNNILPLQQQVSQALIKLMPEMKQTLMANQAKALQDINALMLLKNDELKHFSELIVVSDSLEHFFKNTKLNIIKAYSSEHASLQNYSKLEQILKTDKSQCIVLDLEQNIDIYKKFSKTIAQIDSENWQINERRIDHNFYFNQYIKIINQLKSCRGV
ncbi:zinc ABC transporter substrate-binding protein [Acinetobacter sp.]|uniref:metal ABC transporter substrate-binding protein n=1 Tax=Acinetobacter sp. TaxID=472 RepID=UPI0025C6DCCF|nr:zinc ABC transporter substrate-binding protein [Acinetobacter sp.]